MLGITNTSSVKNQILQEAQAIQRRCEAKTLPGTSLENAGMALQIEISNLDTLRAKVKQAFANRSITTDEDAMAITMQMGEATDAVDKLERFVFNPAPVQSTTQGNIGQIDISNFSFDFARLTTNTSIPSPSTKQKPAPKQVTVLNPTVPAAIKTPTSSTPNPISDYSQTIFNQNHDAEFSGFQDQLGDIQTKLGSKTSQESFNDLLNLGKEIKDYHFSNRNSLLPHRAGQFTVLLGEVQQNARALIISQEQSETSESQQAAGRSASTARFQAMLDIIKKNYGNDAAAQAIDLANSHKNLTAEEKAKFLEALGTILNPPRVLSKGLLNSQLTINQWPGKFSEKQQALEKVIAESAPATAATPSAKLAQEMQSRFDQTFNNSSVPTTIRSSNTPSNTRITSPVSNTTAPAAQVQSPAASAPVVQNKHKEVLDRLTTLCVCFSGLTMEDFQQALLTLSMLQSIEVGGASDRIGYHLYFIHKNEQPELLVDDSNYGVNALVGNHLADNTVRTRAVQRVIVETALGGILEAENANEVRPYLDALESITLNSKDIVPDKATNVAHFLQGEVYHAYVAERAKNSSMQDPNDWETFREDFGRNALRGETNGRTFNLPRNVKQVAVNTVLNAFKAAWKTA